MVRPVKSLTCDGMDAITVIIPTFNRDALLPQAVESVLTQTFPAAEIIVIDDGSTDDTARVIEKIAASSAIPVIYLQQKNRGPAAARNLGVLQAGSDIIAFLDSDDSWHKKKLEIQFQALQECPEHLISHTGEKWYRRGKHLNQREKHLPKNGDIFEQCLALCAVGMSTVMVRKKLFDKYGLFNESLRCCEDYEMWLRVSQAEKFLLVARPLTVKNGGRSDQVSQQFRVGMDRFRIQALGQMLTNEMLSRQQFRAVYEMFITKCEIYGVGCIKHGNDREGEHYLRLASCVKEKRQLFKIP